MRRLIRYAFFAALQWLGWLAQSAYSQVPSCPPNIDFSTGDFRNWECRTGRVSGFGGVNTVIWSGTGQDEFRHRLISPANPLIDDYGRFPQHCPNTSTYSVQLGNDNNGHEAEGLSYTFTIPLGNKEFSLLYYYAVVLQNPPHSPHEQPRFRAKVIDVATEKDISCVSFDFSASGSLPGFKAAVYGEEVYYKDWTPVSVNLSDYAGKTVRLEFITSDCVFQEHFGYAYISIGTSCNGSITGGRYCEGNSTLSITAPYGYKEYRWYSDTVFSQAIGFTQILLLDTAKAKIGDVFPVVVSPYEGYGCLDTLYATIGEATKPVSVAGPDRTTCSKVPVQLGTVNNPNYAYAWMPSHLLQAPFSSNPFTLPVLQQPTTFVVKTTDIKTGCYGYDTATITPVLVDTASSVEGQLLYCPGAAVENRFTVSNAVTSVQWFKNNKLITGATDFTYRPSATGTYWAQLQQFGCTDSTRLHTLRHVPAPYAAFQPNKDIQCINEPIVFTNMTTIANNEPLGYQWRFDDGFTTQTTNVERTFATPGTYTATLIATLTAVACVDSLQKKVVIVNKCFPVLPTAFTPNYDGKNDNLKPYLAGAKGLRRFAVFNRWGELVFLTAKEGEGWDGTYHGKPQPAGVFIWTLEYVVRDNKVVFEKGTVTLIR